MRSLLSFSVRFRYCAMLYVLQWMMPFSFLCVERISVTILAMMGSVLSMWSRPIGPAGQKRIGLFAGGKGEGAVMKATSSGFRPMEQQNASLFRTVADIMRTRSPSLKRTSCVYAPTLIVLNWIRLPVFSSSSISKIQLSAS